jgi:7-carboxy-7-deazaguanine synthase
MPEAKIPIIEIFGPTVQGEGPAAGQIVGFVRIGGCDYRCSWCDSMYAVDPKEVRANSEKLTAEEIVSDLPPCETVIISGGNPALIQGEGLIEEIHRSGRAAHIETQGSRWKEWLGSVDLLIVSPKPPSSGMAKKAEEEVPIFISEWQAAGEPCDLIIKIVVGDEEDLRWALEMRRAIDPERDIPFYLSALTPPDCSLETLADSFRNLCDLVLTDDDARAARPVLLPQLHVLAWGHARGV